MKQNFFFEKSLPFLKKHKVKKINATLKNIEKITYLLEILKEVNAIFRIGQQGNLLVQPAIVLYPHGDNERKIIKQDQSLILVAN